MNPQSISTYPERRRRRRPRRTPVQHNAESAASVRQDSRAHAPSQAPEAVRVPFETLALHAALKSAVTERGYIETTPVQTEVIPVALTGADLIACAETGTGKTAAFLLPILDRLIRESEEAGPAARTQRTSVLILTPTRELAVQIEDDIMAFAYHTPVSSIAVYGGVPSDPQERALRAGADIVVATPGRLMDHMRGGAADFTGLRVLVLDEADRMMDMGFWPDVRHIVSTLPTERQTLLFSATMPPEVVEQARALVRGARMIASGATNGPARTITHRIESMPAARKAEWLGQFLRREPGPVLVFARTKRGADRLASRLAAAGVRVAALHADRTQAQRSAALEGLRSGKYTALVATDVAARGLDIDAITHVINYEVPSTREAYVHRVGRTGRADAAGTAVTLVAPEERKALETLAREIGIPLRDAGEKRVSAGA